MDLQPPTRMAITYRKTAKGVAEIETRAHRLTPRMRSALIFVDGKRSDTELAAMIQQQATETLHALAGQGFIEVLTVSSAPAPAAAVPQRAPAPPPAAPVGGAGPDLTTRRREAVRAVNDLLGPAGASAAVRLERAGTLDDLRAALASAVQTVGAARGRQAAEAFAARFSDV